MAQIANKRLAIIVGGGPAPGINGVISSVTLEALRRGMEVIGVQDGFSHLVQGETSYCRSLSAQEASSYFYRGGSFLGTARTSPAKDPQRMAKVLECFDKLGISYLVTIGGDDTAYSGSRVYAEAKGKIKVAHVPKTIDNDLPLPSGIPTFGFETARQLGVDIARNIHEDARTTGRWYIIVSMGRAAGHLALGIGKASAATLTLIPEEFEKNSVSLDKICDLIIGSMIKRLALGKNYGLVVLAEGLLESIGEQGLLDAFGDDLDRFGNVERDDHGHLRLGEIEFGRIIRYRVAERLKELGLSMTMIDKDLGYELRCADPIPFDLGYTRDLGYSAVKFLLSPEADQYGAIVSVVGGSLNPLKFEEMIDPKTKRMRPRVVDTSSVSFECAQQYMTRLEPEDINTPESLTQLAELVKMTPQQFHDRFADVV